MNCVGPFHQVHVDGHEKMNHLALKLGNITLPIYGARDQFSSKVLLLITAPNVRFADAAGHFYLDLVEELGCTLHNFYYSMTGLLLIIN